jgi:4-hydroxybenzoate polyprenyltransferase
MMIWRAKDRYSNYARGLLSIKMPKETLTDEKKMTAWSRFWIYQKERFPLAAHVPLILAFSFCAASISSRLRAQQWPEERSVLVAFISCLIFFLQLRIADEFKDAEEDARFRPYRPVPRGLVKLKELGILFVLGALLQIGLAFFWDARLIIILLITWGYLAAMSFEFGARKWLKAHPITYLWTHMLIMPLIDLYASAADWIPAGLTFPPDGLIFFLAASLFNGVVIEIGRKIRVVSQEEKGVETYSSLWGCRKAAVVWWIMIVMTALFGCLSAYKAGAFFEVTLPLAIGAAVLGLFVLFFLHRQSERGAKMFEVAAAIWTLLLYLSLGILPGVFSHV